MAWQRPRSTRQTSIESKWPMKNMVDLTMFNQQTWWFMVVYANLRFRFHQVSYMKHHETPCFCHFFGHEPGWTSYFMLFSNPLGDQLSGSPEVPNWSKDTVMRMKGMRGDSFFFFADLWAIIAGWWFQSFKHDGIIFHIWDNPNPIDFFSRWLKPPTR